MLAEGGRVLGNDSGLKGDEGVAPSKQQTQMGELLLPVIRNTEYKYKYKYKYKYEYKYVIRDT